MKEVRHSRWRAVSRVVLLAALGLLPGATTWILVHTLIQRPLDAFVPNRWNDSVAYWHQIKSFSAAGFACGYYCQNEIGAPIDALHYDVHGPLFPMLYGGVASVFGWTPHSAFHYNSVAVAVGVVIFGMLTAVTVRQAALLSALLCVSWTVPLYLPSPNEEPIHMAAALVFAGIFGRLLFISRDVSRLGRYSFWAFLTAMSLMRISWCILALPFLLLDGGRSTRTAALRAPAVATLYTAGVMGVFHLIAAPGGNATLFLLTGLIHSPRDGLRALYLRLAPNVEASFGGARYGTVQAWLCLAVLVVLLAAGVAAWLRQRPARSPSGAAGVLGELAFHWYQLGGILVLSWLFYIADGFERVHLSHLLLSLGLLVVARRKWMLAGLLLAMLLAAPRGWRDFESDHWDDFHVDRALVGETAAALAGLMPYQEDAPSPWCNTVLIHLNTYDRRVIAIPPGLGVAWAFHLNDPRQPFRSRYVLATTHQVEPLLAEPTARLVLLARLREGLNLYRNDGAACASAGAGRRP